MEVNWVSGRVDVKCFAQLGDDGLWTGSVLTGQDVAGRRDETLHELPGHHETEVDAVDAAEHWARQSHVQDPGAN